MAIARRSARARLVALVALTLVFAFGAAAAFAGPSEPTASTEVLQQMLDDPANTDGRLDAYMLTVLRGSKIETIPLEIEAITAGFADLPYQLIQFRVTDQDIVDKGGIASGMSGSPIYVENGQGALTEDALIGALSYGEWETTDGQGWATPIDDMAAIENYPSAMSSTSLRILDDPLIIRGNAVNTIVVTDDPSGFKEAAAANGVLLARPLMAQYVGGLNRRSPLFEAYRKHVESHGGKLLTGLSGVQSTYDAPFQAGGSVAALAASGDLWAGGIGTVTYVNGDRVLAFGHPMNYEGKSGLFMANAWVDGVVWNSLAPYKNARPARVRGRLTQDRSSGIMGIDNTSTPEASVDATVTYRDDSDGDGTLDYGNVGTSHVKIPSFAMNSTSWNYQGLAPISTYIAASKALDAIESKGSAVTTTTVVVKDGADTYTITKPNMYDSSYDIAGPVMEDVSSIVYELQQLIDNGIAHPKIQSVDVVAEIVPTRRNAEVVAVDVAGGLRTGDNTATVSLLEWGVEATQTVDVPFTIPAGIPLTGELQASDAWGFEDGSEMFDEEEYYFVEMSDSVDRRTTAQAVEDIGEQLPNNTLKVTFQPVELISGLEADDEDGPTAPSKPKTYSPIEATKAMDYVVMGGAAKSAPALNVKAYDIYDALVASPTLPYNSEAMVEGELLGATGDVDLAVSRLWKGSSVPTTLKPITFDPEDETFEYLAPAMNRTAKLTFSFAGDENTLAAKGSVEIKIRARTTLTASDYRFKKGKTVTLTAAVTPSTTPGTVVFERYSGGWWYSIGTRTLSSGKAKMSYKPRSSGTYKLRARYVPGSKATNSAGTSSMRTLKVTR